MNFKKLGWCLICLILIIPFSGCNDEQKSYYHNDKKISQDRDSFSYMIRDEKFQSNNETSIKFSSFDGKDTIWNIESDESNDITFKYKSHTTSGKFKGVLITPEETIEKIFEGSENGEKTISLNKGTYSFKIIGQSAKGDVSINIELNDKVKISTKKIWN